MNFLDPFPFQPGTFDVVHMRFVMIHVRLVTLLRAQRFILTVRAAYPSIQTQLPNPDSYIPRLAALLRPGGWLLLEDVNHTLLDAKRPVGPGVQALYRGYYEHMHRQGVDPGVGAKLKDMLQTSKEFSEVNETVIPCYMNPKSTKSKSPGSAPGCFRSDDHKRSDSALQNLGEILKYSIDGVYIGIMEKMGSSGGITPEKLRGWRREVNDPERDLRIDMHLTWSKKS